MKNHVQRFGKFLSAMVMPNIGALIASGLLAALFTDTGWFPNEGFYSMAGFMLTYLIPILVASTGGQMTGGDRGRVAGAIAVTGAIMSSTDTPMLMAAMIIGPLSGFAIRTFDEAMDGRMPAGFEMLINNFSAGIIGMLLAILSGLVIGPVMSAILAALSSGVQTLAANRLLPLVSLFIEPAKVLFLNNAVNHGIFTPLAAAEAAGTGKSVLYLLESNPGPGLGILLAYLFFCKDPVTKNSAPGAIVIHLLGGIHEIYFPYILMNPLIIIAPVLGSMAAAFWFTVTGCGLAGPASPGSLIAYVMMTPGSDLWKICAGILISAGISFAAASPIVRMKGAKSLEKARDEMAAMKHAADVVPETIEHPGEIRKIVFACDAGMGSSAMGATKFRKRIQADRPDISVTNTSADTIPADCDIAVVQTALAGRARKAAPNARLILIGSFLTDPALDALCARLTTGDAPAAPAMKNSDRSIPDPPVRKQIITAEGIRLGLKPVSKEEAINAAGELLEQLGYVDHNYVEAMQEREKLITTYMGMGVAIPHGTTQAKSTVKKTGIVFLQYPDGVDFGEEKAQLIFGIAGIGDEHLDLLSRLCTLLEDEALAETLKTTDDADWVLKQLS